MQQVEVLLSTLNENLKNIKFNDKYQYLVVHQINDGNNKEYQCYIDSLNISIKYIQSNVLGLSKSRNLALDNASADFCWLMDDDTILLDGLDEFLSIHKRDEYDIYCLDYILGDHVKTISRRNSFINRRNAFSISSINICLSKKLINSGIRFDERFGLGTDLPSGEEFIFINQALSKGFKGIITQRVFSVHPSITSGQDFLSSNNKLIAKFSMLKVVYPKTYLLMCFAFLAKKSKYLIVNRKYFNSLYLLVKFFFKNEF